MKITLLFAQFKGNDGPDLVASVDEFLDDENPQYLNEEIEKLKKSSDVEAYRMIDIEIPYKAVSDAFQRVNVEAKVLDEKP